MLPVWPKPVIQYVVEWLVWAWVTDITLIVSQWQTMLLEYFTNAHELIRHLRVVWKESEAVWLEELMDIASISFVFQHEPLWTAHMVWCAEKVMGDSPFFMVYGDTIYHPSIFTEMSASFAEEPILHVWWTEVSSEEISRMGAFDIDNGYVRWIVEKPAPWTEPSRIANMSPHLYTPSIFPYIHKTQVSARGELEVTDSLTMYAQDHRVKPFVYTHPIRDTWSLDSRLRAQDEMATRNFSFDMKA